jgi:hypothetical protein
MIQKQSSNYGRGRAHSHQEQKRCSRSGVQQRACSLFFPKWRGLFIMNLFLITLWSTLTFTVTFWVTREKTCDEKDWNFGATTAGSFITTRPPTLPQYQSLWLTTTWLLFLILPTCQTQPPVISLCFPNWKWNWRDAVLKQCLISKGNPKLYSTELRKMTSTVLLKHGKKRWDRCIRVQGDGSKLSQHLFFYLVRELSGSTSCVKLHCQNQRCTSASLTAIMQWQFPHIHKHQSIPCDLIAWCHCQ